MSPKDPETFFAKLEETGEAEVRNRLASSRVYGSDNASLVMEWLRRKDQVRADEVIREQMAIARDAADSARAAADEAAASNSLARDASALALKANTIAQRANKIAIATVVVAAISAIIVMSS